MYSLYFKCLTTKQMRCPVNAYEMGGTLATIAGVDRQVVIFDREFSPHKPTTLFLPEVLAL